MNICIYSLRNKIIYSKVREEITTMTNFYLCLKYFVQQNPKVNFSYYNFTFDNKVQNTSASLKKADVIIIPAVKEFLYFTGAVHGLYCKRTQEAIQKNYKYLNGKDIIILSVDTAVTKKLIMERTFENKVKPSSLHIICPNDFKMGLQVLEYYFIKEILSKESFTLRKPKKLYDFIYWGSSKHKGVDGKSSDERHLVIKEIQELDNIKSYVIGRWPKNLGINVSLKWTPMNKLAQILQHGRTSICFNWIDQKAITARYQECIALGLFPFVWKDYDSTNQIVYSNFQRVKSVAEYKDKLTEVIKKPALLNTVISDFESRIPTMDYYPKRFSAIISKILKKL